MSTSIIKRYNKEENKWDELASNDAGAIFTNDPLLVDDPSGCSSVEDILLEHQADINLLKKNVSWLALHGGGGYGGGGGPTVINTAKVIIMGPNSNEAITELVWSGITNIRYKISSRGTSKYRVTARVNGSLVYTANLVEKNIEMIIPASTLKINAAQQSTRPIAFEIFAYDEDNNEFSAKCEILIPNITLTSNISNILVTQSLIPTTELTIPIRYMVAIPGHYLLIYSTSQISLSSAGLQNLIGQGNFIDLGEIRDTNPIDYLFDIKKPGNDPTRALISDNQDIGTYPIQIVIVNYDNLNIFSSALDFSYSVVITDTIAIIPSIGISNSNPFSATQDSSIKLRFKVLGNDSGDYWFKIFYEDETIDISSGIGSMGKEVDPTINLNTLGYTLVENTIVRFRVEAGSSRYTAAPIYMYILILPPQTERLNKYLEALDLNRNTIFDYTVDSNDSSQYAPLGSPLSSTVQLPKQNCKLGRIDEVSTQLSFYQVGTDTTYDGYSVGLNHRCYAEITTTPDISWFPTTSDPNASVPDLIKIGNTTFTLDIAFRVGNIGVDSTIMQLGDITSKTNGYGILIKSTEYIIRFYGTTVTGDLQQNNFYHLCFVVKTINDTPKIIVYKNGLYDNISILNISDNISTLAGINKILIGCEKRGNTYINYANVKIYSVRFLTKALNIGQIICSYINNLVCDRDKDAVIFKELLRDNQINTDSAIKNAENNGISLPISNIYNFSTQTYSWGISDLISTPNIGSSLARIPIPIVFLKTAWSWSEFCETSTIADPDPSAVFYYRDAGKEEVVDQKGVNVTIEPQGTTTSKYTIKNINVKFNDVTFSPKDTWYPEQYFVLKADVVDSGHYNNAVIGKFINDCYNHTGLMNTSEEAFPAKNFISNSEYYKKLYITSKTCIEGFPVMLFVGFNNGIDVRYVGIYSFNLGRDSTYNLGLQMPKAIYQNKNIVGYNSVYMPGYFGTPVEFNDDYGALCFEGKSVKNCTTNEIPYNATFEMGDKTPSRTLTTVSSGNWKKTFLDSRLSNSGGIVKYTNEKNNSINVLDDKGNTIPWSESTIKRLETLPDSYFWSTDPSFYDNQIWDLRFRSNSLFPQESSAWDTFKEFGKYVARRFEYHKGSIIVAYNDYLDEYAFNGTTTSKTNRQFQVERPQSAAEKSLLNIRNTAFYYVISMLFGLVDSLGKNLQIKVWVPKNGGDYSWSPCFYDMDTALGLTNSGSEGVPPTVLDYYIDNDPFGECFEIAATNDDNALSRYEVVGNKLWGIGDSVAISSSFNESSISPLGGNYFSEIWSELRTTKLRSSEDFIKDYVENQMKGCSLFAMNADFEVKYINTTETEMLHGNRIDKISKWLRDRIIFLDSLFGYKCNNNNSYLNSIDLNNLDIPYKDTVRIVNGSNVSTIPITLDSSAIVTTTVGTNVSYRKYIEKDVVENLRISTKADNSATGEGSEIQTIINNSSIIRNIDLAGNFNVKGVFPNRNVSVPGPYEGETYTEKYFRNYGNFRNLKKWILRDVKTLKSNVDLFSIFKTWDTGGYADPFLLEELDYTNLQVPSGGQVNIDLSGANLSVLGPAIYKNPFKNLVSIKASNSSVTDIFIPDKVSLMELDIDNSNIQTLTLSGQPLLNFPKSDNENSWVSTFPGCTSLREVKLSSCENLEQLYFDESNIDLRKVEISNCNNLKRIKIDAQYKYLPEISITDCKSLEKVIITRCNLLAGQSPEDIKEIIITGCTSLNTITVSDSHYQKVRIGKIDEENVPTGLINIDLSNSKVNRFNYYTNNTTDRIDLTKISNLGTLNCAGNKSLEYVYFKNDISLGPVTISTENAFQNCTNLFKVRGYIHITAAGVFSGCSRLDLTSIRSWTANNDADAYIGSAEGQLLTHPAGGEQSMFKPISGSSRLNIVISGNGAKSLLSGTVTSSGPLINSILIFYLLRNIHKTSVTSIESMFRSCRTSSSYIFYGTFNEPYVRKMFINCGEVTNASRLFYNTSLASETLVYQLPSPDISNGKDNGVFSPLVKCTNISDWGFTGPRAQCDKNILRRTNGNYALTNIKSFSPVIVDKTFGSSSPTTNGDIENLFLNCPNLTKLQEVFYSENTNINYNTNPKLPIELTSIEDSFKGTGKGELKLQNLFRPLNEGESYSLREIRNSFILNGTSGSNKVEFNLNEHTFDNFNSLISLTHYFYDTNSNNTSTYYPFTGKSLDKIITLSNGQLPNILKNSSEWVNVEGLFSYAHLDENYDYFGDGINIPGNLFKIRSDNNQLLPQGQLNSVRGCFAYIDLPKINLTSEGFSGCTKLTDVSRLLQRDSNHKVSRVIGNPIPLKFFYIAEEEKSSIVYGTNVEIQCEVISAVGNYIHFKLSDDESNTPYAIHIDNYRTLNLIDETYFILPPSALMNYVVDGYTNTEKHYAGNVFKEIYNKQSTSFSYTKYTSPILNYIYCFSYIDVPTFNSDNYNVEPNPNYSPYKYISGQEENSGWIKLNTSEEFRRKYITKWSYDGNKIKYLNWINNFTLSIGSEIINKDVISNIEDPVLNNDLMDETNNHDNSGYWGSLNTKFGKINETDTVPATFAMPPDLFRYSDNTTSEILLTGVFEGCGYDAPYGSDSNSIYGLKGRICPYLLEPVSETSYLGAMFKNCKWLGYYRDYISGGENIVKKFIIPSNFFSFLSSNMRNVSIDEMFSGITFPTDNSFAGVFSSVPEELTLSISGLFKSCAYYDNAIIDSVFLPKGSGPKLTNLIGTFCASENYGVVPLAFGRQKVIFSNVFGPGYLNAESSKVFYGYADGSVTHENPKTLPSDRINKNYVLLDPNGEGVEVDL